MSVFFEYDPIEQGILVAQLAGAGLVWWVAAVLALVAVHVG